MPMAASTPSSPVALPAGPPPTGPASRPVRVLALGNELISDDALGIAAARALCRRLADAGPPLPPGLSPDPAATVQAFHHPGFGRVEVVETALTGMYLLEAVVGASRLIVVDSIVTGACDPGTVLVLREGDFGGPAGSSPHYVGLFEALELARALGLDVPADVVILAVEAGDYRTIGGAMTDPVRAAVPVVVERALAIIEGRATGGVLPAGRGGIGETGG
jgi:hydrogenase maturation protease